MSDQRCSATVYGARVHSWQCTRKAAVERKGKWYCRQHDPEAVRARQSVKDDLRHAEREAQEAIQSEGERLVKRLGVPDAGTHFHISRLAGQSGYRRALVISFEDVERLAVAVDALANLIACAAVHSDLQACERGRTVMAAARKALKDVNNG